MTIKTFSIKEIEDIIRKMWLPSGISKDMERLIIDSLIKDFEHFDNQGGIKQ